MKKFIIFFLCVPLVYSGMHSFINTYTGINGQTIAETPEFFAVTTLDDHQIDYYDSIIMKLIPKQDWMKEFASTYMWKEYTDIREKQQQIYKNNIHVIMKTFTQSHGVHTYQRMYGCFWDDQTGYSQVFDRHGYDGEDFISLDLKENRYTASVAQALPTVMKWNNDRTQLTFLQQYFVHECVFWLKEFLHLSKATFKKTDPPKVSLLQKKQDYYTCHVTGFLYRDTSISWRKNGQALSDSSKLLESGETLPNGDGTFQRRLTLYVLPDEWREDQYSCVVEHKSWTETIQKSMIVKKTKRSRSALDASYIMDLVPVIIPVVAGLIGLMALIGLFVLFVLWKHRKKLEAYSKETIYFKSTPSPEHAATQDSQDSQDAQDAQDSQDSLLSTPSNESTPPSEPNFAAPHVSSTEMNKITHKNFHLNSPSPELKNLKAHSKKKIIYFKSKPSSEHAATQDSQDSLLSNPSYESTPPPEACYAAPHVSFSEMNNTTLQNLPLHSSSPVERFSQPFPTTESCYKAQETSKDL